MGQQYI